MTDIPNYIEFLNENFEQDVNSWFEILSDNQKYWIHTNIFKYLSNVYTKKTFTELISYINTLNDIPGKQELLIFLKNGNTNKYKSSFKTLEGPNGLINEIFNLIKQALEY